MEFTTTNQASLDAGIKVLCYAPAGIGKTVLVATAPRPILISAESGLLSLRRANLEKLFGKDRPDITYDVPTIIVRSERDIQDAYVWMTQSKEALAFDTICIDSISEIAEVALAAGKVRNKDPRKAYGEMGDMLIPAIKAYRDLPGRNVYMSCKMESVKDELSGMMKWGPSMPGQKLGPQLPYLFDEVFRLGVGKDAQNKEFRFLQTQPDLQYDAKDRSGALDPMEYPHLGAIFAKIKGA